MFAQSYPLLPYSARIAKKATTDEQNDALFQRGFEVKRKTVMGQTTYQYLSSNKSNYKFPAQM